MFSIRKLKKWTPLLAAVIVLAAIFAACNSPMGLGDPVDWEPPVLTLDPVRNPIFVRQGARLSGTVTDNVGVERVILRDSVSGQELFRATLLGENRWEINLEFSEEDNGRQIPVEVVAFDRSGNSGESSIRAITMIIDIRPPIVEDIWIQRTNVRRALLEPYHVLRDLERTDPRGDRSANADRFQNGFFHIHGRVAEEETRVEVRYLHIYGLREGQETRLLSLPPLEGASPFAPRWLISEDALLAAGEALWPGYTAAYMAGERYYYRVVIEAVDSSGNESRTIFDYEEFFVMWENADIPKGILDPLVGTVFPRGSTLPVEFFDDDVLERAFTGLLTEEQWLGDRPIFTGNTVIQGTIYNERLEFLRDRLFNGDTVFNWRFDRYATEEPIVDVIDGRTLNELIVMVQTGNADADNGVFYLFTITSDNKLPPHTGDGPEDTNRNRTMARVWRIDVIDENEPLIVFDTVDITGGHPYGHHGDDDIPGARTGNSPEDNTFPELRDGQFFEINGYTLRANREGGLENRVVRFRMAWIPHGMAGGADSHVTAVQRALSDPNYHPDNWPSALAGVQHWDFVPISPELNDPEPAPGHLVTGRRVDGTTDGEFFTKQVFRKSFDVLGGPSPDGLGDPTWRDFHFNGIRENERKLFVFFAEDTMGHQVFRQLRLLGNNTPPTINVYELIFDLPGNMEPPVLDDFDLLAHDGNGNGRIDDFELQNYMDALRVFNERLELFEQMQTHSGSRSPTDPFQTYTIDTTLKYWVVAERTGDLAIDNITMTDISTEEEIGFYWEDHRTLTFVERLPEVTTRQFLFTATDTLGNVARIQRTVAITNAAVLHEIMTPFQSQAYGIFYADRGNYIPLRARFSNNVRWTGPNPPELNVTYVSDNQAVVISIPTITPQGTDSLFLDFQFQIPEGASGMLRTMYQGIGNTPTPGTDQDRPIRLPVGTSIIDSVRDSPAFVPGYTIGVVTSPPWTTYRGSLQRTKRIMLDGERPRLTGLLETFGKTPFESGRFYYRDGETISFRLRAHKPIFTSGVGNPRIQFLIDNTSGPFFADWVRTEANNAMVFSIPVTGTSITQDGRITNISLNNLQGDIVDHVGNTLSTAHFWPPALPGDVHVFVDQTRPAMPTQILVPSPTGANPSRFTQRPLLTITRPTNEPAAGTRQFSLNNGLTWVNFPDGMLPLPGWGETEGAGFRIQNGEWRLRTRYIDRAGNLGHETEQHIDIRGTFPMLMAITAVQPPGTYPQAGNRLDFDLTFDDAVWTHTPANVTITLTNRAAVNNHNTGGVSPSYQVVLPVQNIPQVTPSHTVRFSWTNISSKEMRDGLYVSAVNFAGLRDRFGNDGSTGTGTFIVGGTGDLSIRRTAGDTATYSTGFNLDGAGLIVDDIAPRISSMNPVSAHNRPVSGSGTDIRTSVSEDNRTITITFNEPVTRGVGTITVKPHGMYAIPPVFENFGFYLATDGTRHTTPADDRTWIDGFSDIFNRTTTAEDRRALIATGMTGNPTFTGDPSLGNPPLDLRTGQTVGPYIRMTHGLTPGAGFSGNHSNEGANAPNRSGTDRMIPDTTAKWVLDYRFSINNSTNTQYVPITPGIPNPTLATPGLAVVNNIRDVLTRVRFRWQEFDVSSGAVSINGNVVTIRLPQPLLRGLQWDLCFPEGTFTDLAGNEAPGLNYDVNGNMVGHTGSEYWFWSYGVQTPVIRVNRRSFDARTTGWQGDGRAYSVPSDRGTSPAWNVPGGWGINNFNRVHFRIETETPNARISFGTINGRTEVSGAYGSAFIRTGNTIADTWATTITMPGGAGGMWNNASFDAGNGQWIRPNLIRRTNNNTAASYTVTVNDVQQRRPFQGIYRGFRSHNRDPLVTDIRNFNAWTGIPTNSTAIPGTIENSVSGGDTLFFEYHFTEASKNYVIAVARVNHNGSGWNQGSVGPNSPGDRYVSARGYEGVFRSVVALLQSVNHTGTSGLSAQGSNIKNGMPSIAGFPLRDAPERGDNRFLKLFHATTVSSAGQHIWISTEIVSQWYFLGFGGGGTSGFGSHMQDGENNNYLTAGFGDLTFGFQIRGF